MDSRCDALKLIALIALAVVSGRLLAASTDMAQGNSSASIKWQNCLSQDAAWYGTAEARRIAENVLRYQRAVGGWPKNIDMAILLGEKEKDQLAKQKNELDATIDNGATSTQITYLVKVFEASREPRFKEAALNGIDYLLAAQYGNGGWPQFYPRPEGYQRHITFNDDAMINVMNLLDAIVRRQGTYHFVDEARRIASERAVLKGVECILACQIVVRGRITGWCAQHDEKTFAPASARTYEKASLSGMETVGIVRFLMRIEEPDTRVIAAIEGAVAWLDEARLVGIRVKEQSMPGSPGSRDRVVIEDPSAPPLWARFYEIGTNRPIFSGRDGVIKARLSEIEVERRTGYQWYVSAPARLLAEDYPVWRKRRVAGQSSK